MSYVSTLGYFSSTLFHKLTHLRSFSPLSPARTPPGRPSKICFEPPSDFGIFWKWTKRPKRPKRPVTHLKPHFCVDFGLSLRYGSPASGEQNWSPPNKEKTKMDNEENAPNVMSLHYLETNFWVQLESTRVHVGGCNDPHDVGIEDLFRLVSPATSVTNLNENLDLEAILLAMNTYRYVKNGEYDRLSPVAIEAMEVIDVEDGTAPETVLLPLLKSKLPAITASVRFLPINDSPLLFYSRKKLININGSSWKHTGCFCIDIDRGKQGNEEDERELWNKCANKLPEVPGFRLMFASPNGGVKAIFFVDGETRYWLEEGDVPTRLGKHKHVYTQLLEATANCGIFGDPKCCDVGRLTYLYNERSYFTEELNPSFFTPEREGFIPAPETITIAEGDGLPSGLSRFLSWMENKEPAISRFLSYHLTYYPDGYKSPCPCCLGRTTGVSGNKDLWLIPGDEEYGTIRATCLHSSCTNGVSSVDGKPVKSMQDWLREYEAETSEAMSAGGRTKTVTHATPVTNEEDGTNTAPVTYEEGNPKEGEADYFEPIISSYVDSHTSRGTTYFSMYKPLSSREILATAKDYDESKLEMEEVKGNPVPCLSMDNIEYLLTTCFQLYPFYDSTAGDRIVVDMERMNISAVMDENNFITPVAQALHEHVYRRYGVLDSRVETALRKKLIDLSNYRLVNVFDRILEQDDWDGEEDRVGKAVDIIADNVDPSWSIDTDETREYIASLIAHDPATAKKIGLSYDLLDTKNFVREVLKTWLVCAYRKFIHAGDLSRFTNQEEIDNMCPVIFGTQGCGKNSFISALVKPLGMKYLWNPSGFRDIDGTNKDNSMKAAESLIAHLDEIDNYTLRKDDTGALKQIITKTQSKVRLPYDKRMVDLYTKVSYIGSTNHDAFLIDSSGNRRFIPLFTVGKFNYEKIRDWLQYTNIWPQVKKMAEEDIGVGRYTWERLNKIIDYNNREYAMVEGNDTDLLDHAVLLDDMDKRPDGTKFYSLNPITTLRRLMEQLREDAAITNAPRITNSDLAKFKNDLVRKFKLGSTKDLMRKVRFKRENAKTGEQYISMREVTTVVPRSTYHAIKDGDYDCLSPR